MCNVKICRVIGIQPANTFFKYAQCFQAKMRQIYLEETYGGNMRELELLLSNFNFDGEEKKVKTGTKTSKCSTFYNH